MASKARTVSDLERLKELWLPGPAITYSIKMSMTQHYEFLRYLPSDL